MSEYFRGCCTFSAFVDGFLGSATRHKFPIVLVDTLRARRDWRSGMTGSEALLMQRQDVLRDGEYMWITRHKNDDDDGGIPVIRCQA